MGSFSTCEQSQLLLYYSSFKGEKITPFRFVASEQKRTNILFSSHCFSLNSFSHDFIVFLESPLCLPKYSVIAQGWAGENEKSCFLICTLFLSNGSDGSYHIWKRNILSQPEYWSIQAYLIQRKKTSDSHPSPLVETIWFKFTTTTQSQDLLAPTYFHFLVVRGREWSMLNWRRK